MESSGTGGSGGMSDRVGGALEDLRKTAESAGGDVRARIDDAVEQIRDATSSVQAHAESTAGEVRVQLEGVRDWVQSATTDLLDELQKEIDKRRAQLTGSGGDSDAGSSGGSAA